MLASWPAYDFLETALANYIAPAMKPPTSTRQAELVITAGYSMFLGPAFAVLLNLFTPKRSTLQRNLGSLDELLSRAQYEEMPVSVTLTSNKVYIGLVKRITDPEHPPVTIKLFPMLSGYRDAEGRLSITTDYQPIYSTLDSSPAERELLGLPNEEWETRFEIVLRADAILSATMFSPSVYAKFNPNWRETLGKPAPTVPTELRVEIVRQPKSPVAPPGSTIETPKTNA